MWNMELLTRLHPKIIDVVIRDRAFWEISNYKLYRNETKINTLACVESGNAMLELDGQAYELRSGTVFMLVPGQTMRITTVRNDPVQFHSFHYYRAFVQWEGKEAKLAEGMQSRPDKCVDAGASHLHPLFVEAYRIWQEKRIGYEWKALLMFNRVLDELAGLYRSAEAMGNEKAIARCMEFMRAHYHEPITRKDIAGEAALSESYLSTMFKKHAGVSPIQYLNKLRLDAAKRLLRTTGLTVADIAGQTGFTDSFYFARVFSKEVGMTPSEYRKA